MKLSKGRKLKWCEEHDEPVIVYRDGSWRCWWQLVVETGDESHCKLIPVPPTLKDDDEEKA